jgi:flagellin
MTNTAAIAALDTLRSINAGLNETQNRVSSGYRVESASDNAAYWSIATTMRSDNKALDRKSTRLNSSHRLTSRMPSSA